MNNLFKREVPDRYIEALDVILIIFVRSSSKKRRHECSENILEIQKDVLGTKLSNGALISTALKRFRRLSKHQATLA